MFQLSIETIIKTFYLFVIYLFIVLLKTQSNAQIYLYCIVSGHMVISYQ